MGRPEEALAAIDQAILLQPTNEGMYRNKASILQGLGRKKEARSCLKKAKELAREAEARKIKIRIKR